MIMYKFTSILAGCGSLIFLQPGVGAADAPFVGRTLEAYLERAQAANPDLETFRQRYEAALERIPQARSLPDPMLQTTYFVESMRTAMGAQEQEVMLSQEIPWFGKRSTRAAVASAEAEALWYAFQNKQLMLVRNVASAFFEYAYTGKTLELEAENLRLLEELEPSVEERVRTGGDLNPLLRLKVEIGRVGDRLRSLEQQRHVLSARLAGLLALAPDPPLPWPELEVPSTIELNRVELARALEANNPELAMLERQIASAEAARALSRLEDRPDLRLGVNYMFMGDRPDPSMDAGNNPWGITLGLNIPIWQGKYRAQRREAASLQRASEHEREDRLNTLRAELTARLADLQDADRRIKLYGEELLDLARQSLDITRSSYQGGRAGILEVIDSEQSLVDLELLYWRAAADAWQQRVTIQTLTNQPIAPIFNATQP